MIHDPSSGSRANDWLAKAWLALEDGNAEGALRAARKARTADPSDAEARYAIGAALLDLGAAERALPELAAAAKALPNDPDVAGDLGVALFQCARFAEAERSLESACSLGSDVGYVWFARAVCLERRGDKAKARTALERAHALAADEFPAPVRIAPRELERMAAAVLDELPPELGERLAGVPIRIDEFPSDELLAESVGELDPTILGAFLGVPYPEQVSVGGGSVLPETIVLYRRNIELSCADEDEVREQVRITLLHEIGHWLGLDEDDLADRGLD